MNSTQLSNVVFVLLKKENYSTLKVESDLRFVNTKNPKLWKIMVFAGSRFSRLPFSGSLNMLFLQLFPAIVVALLRSSLYDKVIRLQSIADQNSSLS